MPIKIITENRKAFHDYFIIETFETGIILKGTEVKSLREGKVNLKDSFAMVEDEEIFLHNCHISPYQHGNIYNHDPLRTRKLLLHKNEIKKLIGKTVEKGLTLIPLKFYFKHGIAKVELALAKGKKMYDKRENLKKRAAMREIEKAFKDKHR
ncbi:MAG: SsrA-binding protein SmpB [Nitrospinae bacterium]|nr:SsrA-binding protein SmpB [Nitrospinota bacterium]